MTPPPTSDGWTLSTLKAHLERIMELREQAALKAEQAGERRDADIVERLDEAAHIIRQRIDAIDATLQARAGKQAGVSFTATIITGVLSALAALAAIVAVTLAIIRRS